MNLQDRITEAGGVAAAVAAGLPVRNWKGRTIADASELGASPAYGCCDRCGRVVTADMVVDLTGASIVQRRLTNIIPNLAEPLRTTVMQWLRKPIADMRWLCDGCWRWPVQVGWVTPQQMRRALGMSDPNPNQTL